MNDPSKRRKVELVLLGLATTISAIALGVAAARASETITYNYDARGRLVTVSHSGSVNANVVANYSYDKADNRTNKNVTGAP